jgi:hypothetical protein
MLPIKKKRKERYIWFDYIFEGCYKLDILIQVLKKQFIILIIIENLMVSLGKKGRTPLERSGLTVVLNQIRTK